MSPHYEDLQDQMIVSTLLAFLNLLKLTVMAFIIATTIN